MRKGFLILVIGLIIGKVTSAQNDYLPAFQEKWGNSKPYLLKIARKMPARHYDFKPTDRQMTFKAQLLHIRENMLKLSQRYIQEGSFEDTVEPGQLSKTQTINLLIKAFDEVKATVKQVEPNDLNTTVDFFKGRKTKLQVLNLIQDHVTHHRGQLIVYLNLKGLEPPDYVGW